MDQDLVKAVVVLVRMSEGSMLRERDRRRPGGGILSSLGDSTE